MRVLFLIGLAGLGVASAQAQNYFTIRVNLLGNPTTLTTYDPTTGEASAVGSTEVPISKFNPGGGLLKAIVVRFNTKAWGIAPYENVTSLFQTSSPETLFFMQLDALVPTETGTVNYRLAEGYLGSQSTFSLPAGRWRTRDFGAAGEAALRFDAVRNPTDWATIRQLFTGTDNFTFRVTYGANFKPTSTFGINLNRANAAAEFRGRVSFTYVYF